MAVRLEIRTKELKAALRKASGKGMARAAQQYQTDLKMALNTPNTGKSVAVKRQTPGGNKKTRTIYPNPSTPPDPPHKRTGNLQRNVVREIDRTIPAARIGVTKAGIYGLYHELGSGHLPRRIWLMSTLENRHLIYARLLTVGVEST